jgi:hypothetical protein
MFLGQIDEILDDIGNWYWENQEKLFKFELV